MLAICTFSAISPCNFRMEAHRHVEFTGVELAALVEMARVGERCSREGGR
jgi:hypothetical protein